MNLENENYLMNDNSNRIGTETTGITISSAPVMANKTTYNNDENETPLLKYLSLKNKTTTAVFVSNISELSNDNLIRQLLQFVGKIVNWKRVQGANKKLESFGFVEFSNQEDALRAMRILNGLIVCDRPLLTTVDEKTRVNLDKYEQEQQEFIKARLKPGDPNEIEQITNLRKLPDETARLKIQELLNGHVTYGSILNSYSKYDKNGKDEELKKTESSETIKKYQFSRIDDKKKKDESRKPKDLRRKSDMAKNEDEMNDYHDEQRRQRRMKYKNECYTNRLKRWENYEENLLHELNRRSTREKRKMKEREERIKKNFEIYDRYDDDRDDIKYFHGSAWQNKLIERQSELECDARDIKRENSNAEAKENEEILSDLESDPENFLQNIKVNLPKLNDENIDGEQTNTYYSIGTDLKDNEEENLVHGSYKKSSENHYNPDLSKPIGFDIKKNEPTSYINPVTGLEEIFVPDEMEIIVEPVAKKVKLTVIDEKTRKNAPQIEYGPESAKLLTSEEKAKKIKKLICKIPTNKSELFKYDIKWYIVDQKLVEKKIRPWLKKKILEYIGEEENTLVKFICQKIYEKCTAEKLLNEISMILDDESETFVIKLWRLLIYETEAKSMGLIQD